MTKDEYKEAMEEINEVRAKIKKWFEKEDKKREEENNSYIKEVEPKLQKIVDELKDIAIFSPWHTNMTAIVNAINSIENFIKEQAND